MNLESASSFRRMACGLCLLAGPALLLVASIVDPVAGSGDEDRAAYQALKDDPDLAQLNIALSMVGFLLVAVGIVGVIHVIRERGVVLAHLGGALALVGLIMFVGLTATNVGNLNLAEHLDLDTAVKLEDDVEDYWVAYLVFVPALLGTFLGFILLAAAIIRSKVAHVAAAVLIILGILTIPASEDSKAVGIVANVLLLAGWGLVALKLLGMTDEQWDGRADPEASPSAA